ncbi:MAG: hypothetical protein ACREFX_06375 [Opitutaceae bacterium]
MGPRVQSVAWITMAIVLIATLRVCRAEVRDAGNGWAAPSAQEVAPEWRRALDAEYAYAPPRKRLVHLVFTRAPETDANSVSFSLQPYLVTDESADYFELDDAMQSEHANLEEMKTAGEFTRMMGIRRRTVGTKHVKLATGTFFFIPVIRFVRCSW